MKTLISWIGIYAFCMIATFVNPAIGVWGFIFESNFHPPLHYWGDQLMAIGSRWSFYIGAAAIVSYLLNSSQFKENNLRDDPCFKLLLAYVANCYFVSMFFAVEPEKSLSAATDALKWVMVYAIYVKTHSNRPWLVFPLMIYSFSVAYMGFDETFNPTGGRSVMQGPVSAYGENFVSPHAIALLPFTATCLINQSFNFPTKIACALCIPFQLNLVALGSSRGAFLALIATAIFSLYLSKGRLRIVTLCAIAVAMLLGARLFHEQFWNRMNTIATYQEDGSAMGRVEAWNAAWRVFKDNPLGIGAEGFDSGVGASYMGGEFHTTHNLFFEILAAWGIIGTVLFFSAILVGVRRAKKIFSFLWNPHRLNQSSFGLQAFAIYVGLLSMLIASMFVNRMKWELWYIFLAHVTCLVNTFHRQTTAQTNSPEGTVS